MKKSYRVFGHILRRFPKCYETLEEELVNFIMNADGG